MGEVDIRPLLHDNDAHIVLLVLDGLGGYADDRFDSELEQARTPNLDELAAQGSVGLVEPAGPGITVGSGPGHLSLFGYDPTDHQLGRGVLSAVGVGFDLQPGDVAARGNLATLGPDGRILDRRAGRIGDAPARAITQLLDDRVRVPGVEVAFRHIAEHRVLLVLRGNGLDPRVADQDPQRVGVPPLTAVPLHADAQRTADALADVDRQVREALVSQPADVLLLRGFDTLRRLPSMQERFGLQAATVADYPMYRGVAQLVGMTALERTHGLAGQIEAVRAAWDRFDYFFLHHKETDRAGHDGERDAKVAAIEAVDELIPDLLELGPEVLIVTGDHSSPTQLSGHSWHPVPVVMWGPRVGRDAVTSFGERACAGGLIGRRPTQDLMRLALAAAGRLEKWGA